MASPSTLAHSLGHNTLGKTDIAVQSVLLGIVFVFVGLRLWSRRFQSLQLNDLLIIVATFLMVGRYVVEIMMVVLCGMGLHSTEVAQVRGSEVFVQFNELTYAGDLLWVTVIALVQLSILNYYVHNFSQRALTVLAYIITVLCSALWVASFFATAFFCTPPKRIWLADTPGHCGDREMLHTSVNASEAALSFLVVILPVSWMWRIPLSKTKKIALICIQLLGLGIITIIAIRLKSEFDLDPEDTTYSSARKSILSCIVPPLGIIVACLPTLEPAIQSMFRKPALPSTAHNSIYDPSFARYWKATVLSGKGLEEPEMPLVGLTQPFMAKMSYLAPGNIQPKKVTLACEKCRVLKVKCIRPEEGQPCTKCARSNAQCVFSEPKQRARASQRTKPRLAELESKLTNIIGLLSQSGAPLHGVQTPVDPDCGLAAIPEYSNDNPHPTAEWMSQGYLADPELNEALGASEEQNTTEVVPEKSWDATAIDAAWITELGLGPAVLEHLLDKFRGMASYFPFVQLSYAWTAASMAEDRPFLLLAAVAAASSQYCHLQDALIRQFKQTLSQRVIIAGEKDLDLLQGLLVHLAWYHFHFVPGSAQYYQYLQIGIGMVIELRLDQEAAELLEQRTELGDAYIREACRAYLGCYYMSSIISMSSGKPNNLQFHEAMLRCAMILQQQPEFDTDLLIYPVTKVLQFAEEVCETYQSEGIHGTRLYIHAERFTTRLEEWWSSLSTDLRSTVLLINCYHTVKIRIQEMGLVYCYGQRRPPSPKAQEDSTMLSTPPMVISNLVKCVSSTKEYLDLFFTIPAVEHNSLPISAWYQVILTIFVLYRLSVGLPEVPEWNGEIAQETVNLEEYLDTLLSNLQAIKPSPDRQIPTKSLFSMMHEIIGSVKNSYALTKENLAHVHDSHHAHHDLASKNTAASAQGLHRCPALRYSSRRIAQAPDQPTLQNAIATEVQKIGDEKLWGDILLMDAFHSMTGSSATAF
ncbi:transcriptional regulator family: Fungal Specific TF [Penicillium roqueforti]|nr:transcriptional regulator family: Fungal Specific TF [Penicillium roqueforti]KAI3246499.1 transcriptional regulator family: Fungal Specific TF [Penicillium roqueforti]